MFVFNFGYIVYIMLCEFNNNEKNTNVCLCLCVCACVCVLLCVCVCVCTTPWLFNFLIKNAQRQGRARFALPDVSKKHFWLILAV
jgi:hypothetical protein